MTHKDSFELPDTVDLAAVNEAEVEIIRLATQRQLDPREAYWFSRMLEHRRRAIGDRTLEEQMDRIEELKRAAAEAAGAKGAGARKARGRKP
jgi:hypothetical protein